MGEANKRGTLEQRKAAAIERNRLTKEARQQDLLRRRTEFGNRQGKSRLAMVLASAMAVGLSSNFKIEE